ncbi:hypothetical protein EVAR_99921_1 [Eumeta japonica]|uniref:Uncharacterized protein n=1 Tax=Eumeta variegata TaxID=151549 RepID=A0A4C1YX37_EUMVA|nr:hypothetical protein EVAR_99921_1 [Eumeta japonica]
MCMRSYSPPPSPLLSCLKAVDFEKSPMHSRARDDWAHQGGARLQNEGLLSTEEVNAAGAADKCASVSEVSAQGYEKDIMGFWSVGGRHNPASLKMELQIGIRIKGETESRTKNGTWIGFEKGPRLRLTSIDAKE